MFTVSTAKRLLPLTALCIPLDVFLYGNDLGWGVHFVFGRYVDTAAGSQFLFPWEFIDLYSRFDSGGQVGLIGWAIASVLVVLVTAYLIGSGFTARNLPLTDRHLGAMFILAGGLFIASRFLMYDLLLLGEQSDIRWMSIPIGALYVLFIGVVFYHDLFRMGMQPAESEVTNT